MLTVSVPVAESRLSELIMYKGSAVGAGAEPPHPLTMVISTIVRNSRRADIRACTD
jgi:hypothetical protein